jgi:hypothetical protein
MWEKEVKDGRGSKFFDQLFEIGHMRMWVKKYYEM